jgi:drug/metabolite transporter (DMT)-like permease
MSLSDHSNATLLVSIVGVVIFGAATLPLGSLWPSQQWIVPTMTHLGLFLVTGLLMGVGQYCLIEALRVAEAGLIAPFKYTSYAWALMLGFALWGDLPSVLSIAGVMLVVTSGLYVFFREQTLARRRVNDSKDAA